MSYSVQNLNHRRWDLLRLLVCCGALLLSPPRLVGAESGKTLYDRIVALDAGYESCLALTIECRVRLGYEGCKHITCNAGGNPLFGGGDSKERDALAERLKALSTSDDPEAAFYWGHLNWTEGQRIATIQGKPMQDHAQQKFDQALSSFQVASKAGSGAASWNIAVIYEQGHGVTRSKLAAAEWYAKSGHQYLKNGEREKALAALERAEEIDPKHPDAAKLRAVLFPPTKRK